MATASLSIEIVLDRCLRAIREGSYSIDDCLAHYPDHKDELEPLLLSLLRLQSGRILEAPQDFRNAAMTRMNDLVKSHPRPSKRRARIRLAGLEKASGISKSATKMRFHFKSVLLMAFVLMVIFVVAGVGIGYAASSAMPGSFFYPIKNTVEMLRLEIFSDDYNDAILYLNFSQHRLEEAKVLMQSQQYGEAKYALLDYQVQAHYTLENLDESSPMTNEQRIELARISIDYYLHNQAYLQVLLTQAPEMLLPSVETALDLTLQILERAMQLTN